MSIVLTVVILGVNGLISWANCYVCGRAWSDFKREGGFGTVLLYCGATQAAVGFSMILLFVLALVVPPFMTLLSNEAGQPYLTSADVALFHNWMFSLWYVAVIVPALGTGIIITVHSVREAFRTKRLADGAIATWNVAATAHNVYRATQDLGPAIGSVGDMFSALTSGDDSKAKAAGLAIACCLLALLGGVMITVSLIRHYARTAPALTARAYG